MAAIFSSNRQNINKWWFLLAFFVAFLRRWRSRPTTFERTQQWTRSMVLEKTKKYYYDCYLVSQKGRKIVKNAASYSSSSVKAFFWLWRERWGQMHIDDICGPLTNSNSSLFVRRSQPHSSSNSTYYNNCSTHKSIVLSEARSRSNYPWWRLPSAMICVPEWPRFFQKRSAFLFTQKSEMIPIAKLRQFYEIIRSEHCQRSDVINHFCASGKQSNQTSRAWSLTSTSAYLVRCFSFFHIFLKFFPLCSSFNNTLL